MNTKQTVTFGLFSIIYITATLLDSYPFSWLLKLIPLLILIVVTAGKLASNSDKLFLTGLLFSVAGDFFLGYDPKNWFILGLGAFLFAHVFYLLCLMPVVKKKLSFVVIYLVIGLAMFSIIYPGLGPLLIPVFAYMSVLLLMATLTIASKKSNFWLIIGGASFAASDTLLGINKFATPLPYASVMIMLTYYLAQYSLVKGIFLSREANQIGKVA